MRAGRLVRFGAVGLALTGTPARALDGRRRIYGNDSVFGGTELRPI